MPAEIYNGQNRHTGMAALQHRSTQTSATHIKTGDGLGVVLIAGHKTTGLEEADGTHALLHYNTF